MLLVCLRNVGVSDAEVGWTVVLAVFAFARLVTAVPITPGGAGLVEAALIARLVGAGGDKSQVAAAVLIYRALTWPCQSWSASPALGGGGDKHGRPRPNAPIPAAGAP